MTDDVKNLIDALADGNKSDANNIFNDIMSDRMNDSLEAKKIEIGSQLYNGTVTAVDSESAEDVIGKEAIEDI